VTAFVNERIEKKILLKMRRDDPNFYQTYRVKVKLLYDMKPWFEQKA